MVVFLNQVKTGMMCLYVNDIYRDYVTLRTYGVTAIVEANASVMVVIDHLTPIIYALTPLVLCIFDSE